VSLQIAAFQLLDAKANLDRHRYAPAIMVDGNMTADHERPKYGAEDVCLSDGTGHFVERAPFQDHCKTASNVRTVSIRGHQVSQI
jgi:hypothetical protein